MVQQVKLRLTNPDSVEEKLKNLCKSRGETSSVHTYYKQPSAHILKIVEDEDGAWLMKLKQQGQGFAILQYDPIDDVRSRKSELDGQWERTCTLYFQTKGFENDDFVIRLIKVKDLGDFLIIEREDVNEHSVYAFLEELGIKKPDFVTVPFDVLKNLV